MGVALYAAELVEDAVRARRRDERLLACTLAASVLVHTAAVALAPGFRKPDSEAPRPLEVRIVQPPVPQPIRVEPPPRPKPTPPLARAPAVKPEPQPKRAPAPAAAPERKPVLALPETASPATPSFTVPQPSVEPPRVETKAVAAAPAAPSAPAPAAGREAAVTAPLHDAAHLNNPKPRYPLVAKRQGIEGTVHLRVLVSKEGRALQVDVERSSGSTALDNSALDAVRAWKFVPGRRGHEPIEQPVTFPVHFRLESPS